MRPERLTPAAGVEIELFDRRAHAAFSISNVETDEMAFVGVGEGVGTQHSDACPVLWIANRFLADRAELRLGRRPGVPAASLVDRSATRQSDFSSHALNQHRGQLAAQSIRSTATEPIVLRDWDGQFFRQCPTAAVALQDNDVV